MKVVRSIPLADARASETCVGCGSLEKESEPIMPLFARGTSTAALLDEPVVRVCRSCAMETERLRKVPFLMRTSVAMILLAVPACLSSFSPWQHAGLPIAVFVTSFVAYYLFVRRMRRQRTEAAPIVLLPSDELQVRERPAAAPVTAPVDGAGTPYRTSGRPPDDEKAPSPRAVPPEDSLFFKTATAAAAFLSFVVWSQLVADVRVWNEHHEPCTLSINGRTADAVTGVRWERGGNIELELRCTDGRAFLGNTDLRGAETLELDVDKMLFDGSFRIRTTTAMRPREERGAPLPRARD